ncbi:hypothetical protein ACF1BQ_029960 [Bradyrhizobium sp. RDT10]
MISQLPGSWGLLKTDRGLPDDAPIPSLPNTIVDPAAFDFPVISETVTGASVEKISRGDPALESAYIAAARRLVERGAVAISSTCGFSVRYQSAVAAAVNVPVAMSSLILLPTMLRQLPASASIAIVTYDSARLGEDLLGIDNPADRTRIMIGGIEGASSGMTRGRILRRRLTSPRSRRM